MKTRVNIILTCGMLLVPTNVSVNLQTNDNSPFTAMPGVFVTTRQIQVEREPQSLTQDEIKSEVEGWLRNANIRVLTREEWLNTLGQPTLEIIAGVSSRPGTCPVYYVEMRLFRKVLVESDPTLKAKAAVWQYGPIIGVSAEADSSGYPVILEEALRKATNGFIDSYLQANAK